MDRTYNSSNNKSTERTKQKPESRGAKRDMAKRYPELCWTVGKSIDMSSSHLFYSYGIRSAGQAAFVITIAN